MNAARVHLPRYIDLFILVAGIVLSIGVGLLVHRANTRQDSIRFEAQVNQVQSRIRGRIERFESLLIQTRGFLRNKKSVTREEYEQYIQDIQLKERFPAIQGLAYVARVPALEVDRHVNRLHREGSADFRVFPTDTKDEFYPVTYIEPADWRNNRALGFDMFSEPVRRTTMEQARDTGRPTLSSSIKLLQETNEAVQPGFIMFLPVYREGAKTETVEERRSALVAFLGAPFRAHDFFTIIFRDQNPLVDFEVFDSANPSRESLIYDYDKKDHGSHLAIRRIDLAGHTYMIGFNQLDDKSIAWVLPFVAGLGGIIISFLLWWIFRSIKVRAEESRRAEEALAFERTKLHSLMLQAPVIFSVTEGPEHVFTIFNKAAAKGIGGRDCTGLPIRKALSELEGKGFFEALDRAYKTGEPIYLNESPADLVQPNGSIERNYFNVIYQPWRDSTGKIAGVMNVSVNVTEQVLARMKLEASQVLLEKAKDEAERANELKSAFLANMSHEIRTPLGAMIGFSDLLRDPSLSQTERSNYLDIMTRNGEQLSVIINDILDLSKVEAGHLTLEYTDVRPEQIVADVVSLLGMKAKEKNLALEFSFENTAPKSLVTDPTRLRQILLNLAQNAIKFTQAGSVKIRGYGFRTAENRQILCFDVDDTGIGIPAEQQENIFEMFVQADGSMTRRFGGTGLGLALSRSLARALGGDVLLQKTSKDGGTTFKIVIEDQPEKREAASNLRNDENLQRIQLNEKVLQGVRVLVVDDAPDNQQLIRRYLIKHGAIVESAENGLIGYQKALADSFDLVLMDIQMPEMDGYTATAKLRSAGYTKPIIALTAHAMSEVRKKCLNVGYTDHLPKPINPKELVSAIALYTSH